MLIQCCGTLTATCRYENVFSMTVPEYSRALAAILRESGQRGEPRSILGHQQWRKLHNEELNNLYCSPNIVRVIKSRRMKWARYVASMGARTDVFRFWWGNVRE